jgi:hypothetical protein
MPEIRRPSHQDRFKDSKGKEELSFLGDHGNPLGDIGPVHLLHGNKFKKNLSLLGFKKMIEDLQEGGLPGSIGPDHTHKLSLLDSKRDVLEHPIFMITERDGIDFNHNVLITFLVLKR